MLIRLRMENVCGVVKFAALAFVISNRDLRLAAGGYYYQINERTKLDIYVETFHIIDLLAKVHAKDKNVSIRS